MHNDKNSSSKVPSMIANKLSVGDMKKLANSLFIVSWKGGHRGSFKNWNIHSCTLVGTTISNITILHDNKIYYQACVVAIDDCNIPTCINCSTVGYIPNHFNITDGHINVCTLQKQT